MPMVEFARDLFAIYILWACKITAINVRHQSRGPGTFYKQLMPHIVSKLRLGYDFLVLFDLSKIDTFSTGADCGGEGGRVWKLRCV